MTTKQTTCRICDGKLGFLNHKFENGIKICNKCFTAADIKLSELTERGQGNIPIKEIEDRINNKTKENVCDVCGKELSFFKTKRLDDSKICSTCLSAAQLTFKELNNLHKIKLAEILPRINGDVRNFEPSKRIGKFVQFNNENRKMLIMPGEIIGFDSIVSYELMEDGDTIASGGLGRAAIGGALFGGAGAVVGAVTGNRKGNCRKLQIKITVDSTDKSATYITFIDKKTKKSSSSYKEAFEHAQECLSTLELITTQSKEDEKSTTANSSADEIMKFKELLDIGAITEEEYEVKKKELLGL